MGRMESAPSSNDPPAAADRLIDSAILPGRSASRTWRFIMMLSPGSMAESFDQSHRHPIYLLLQTFPFHLLRPATLSYLFAFTTASMVKTIFYNETTRTRI